MARRLMLRAQCLALALVGIGLFLLLPGEANAQQGDASGFPNRPIRIVVGFAPGGGNDIMSRIYAQKLTERLGVPVLVENKPGAGGFIAAEIVARAPADGYTWFSATTGTLVIAPAVYSKLPYDPIKSFAPIGVTANYPLVLVVESSRGIGSVKDLVAYIKAHPDKANYGSSSPLFQLPTELLKSKTGTKIEHIPFKGSTEVVGGLINGQLLMSIIDPGPVLPHMKSGKFKALATTGNVRFAEMPDVPTLKELGVDVTMEAFMGFVSAAGTPPAAIKRLETELAALRKMPDLNERMTAAGMPVAGGSAKEMADILVGEIPKWTAVAKAANIKLD